jgi:hypothetical protein
MTPNRQFDERHQDYVFACPDLASGQLAAALQLQLDADWPFELRSIAAWLPPVATGPTAGTQDGLQFISMRWAGPVQDYRQQGVVPLPLLLGPYFGQLGNPKPVYPSYPMPRQALIQIDVQNNGPNKVSGMLLIFRGVKKGPVGSMPYSYPQKMARPPLPFLYPIPNLTSLGVSETRTNVPFAPENDSDFAFRFGQAGALGFYQVFITLKDESWKPYSNAPVPADVFFGRSFFPAVFPCGASFIAPVGPGASQPGLAVPELYIPQNHKMWFDITRNDSGYAGAVSQDYPLTFGGCKVYPG